MTVNTKRVRALLVSWAFSLPTQGLTLLVARDAGVVTWRLVVWAVFAAVANSVATVVIVTADEV